MARKATSGPLWKISGGAMKCDCEWLQNFPPVSFSDGMYRVAECKRQQVKRAGIKRTGIQQKAVRKRRRHPCGASLLPGINKTSRASERVKEGHNNIQCETGKEGVAASIHYDHNQLSLRAPRSCVCERASNSQSCVGGKGSVQTVWGSVSTFGAQECFCDAGGGKCEGDRRPAQLNELWRDAAQRNLPRSTSRSQLQRYWGVPCTAH